MIILKILPESGMKWLMLLFFLTVSFSITGCTPAGNAGDIPADRPGNAENAPVSPLVVTEPVKHDTDDPAIWIHPDDPSQSLIIGTDKDEDGALFVFDLQGRIVQTVPGLLRPNNVDVAYGFMLGGVPTDIAVVTERYTSRIRVFSLPGLQPVDGGGIEVFEGEEERAPMGIALYKRPADDALFAIVSRKDGPEENYLWQYRLIDDGTGKVKAAFIRAFGKFSGANEIEAIAVDNALGYVYYSDETVGVRKYHADPDAPHAEKQLAIFATDDFQGDHEGISIYEVSSDTGYIIVSDQQDHNEFHIYPREGAPGNPHEHILIKVVKTLAGDSDGSEVTSGPLNDTFPQGLFVAMSDDKTFHFYSWADFAGDELRIAASE